MFYITNTSTRLQLVECQSQGNGEIELTMVVKVTMPKVAQTPELPSQLEAWVESCGQQYKRLLYQYLIERADSELLSSKKQTQQLRCRGYKPYSFNTVFGRVLVKRIQVSYANGCKEILSINSWQTPQHSCITKGLRKAICGLAVITSLANTQKEISRRTSDKALVSAGSVLNILHQEGSALSQAQELRARAVYEEMPEVRGFQIDTTKPWRKRLPPLTDDLSESDFEGSFGIKVLWHWEAGHLTLNLPQHTQAEGLIIIEADECLVAAQPGNKQKDIWCFTGVVNADGHAYYFTADSTAKLWYQIGALLGVLGAHQGHREVLILSDGARWIRRWYRELPIARRRMCLCWYHLTQTVHDLLTSGFGYARGLALEGVCLRHLWRGEVMAAVSIIESYTTQIINKPKIRRLVRYLKARLPIIPNYQQCRSEGEWVANTKVEKFNDLVIARRCKGEGRAWGPVGVRAIAALLTAERNGELDEWWRSGELPSWKKTITDASCEIAEREPRQDFQTVGGESC